MSFVSYAQNFEDVLLWRVLKHVDGGFYIDIGAQDPVVDSVSLAFYEHGWRGVHVEPTTQYAKKLREARPGETVMQVAVGSNAGSLTFFEFRDTGLSTADPAIARQHREHGFECVETHTPVISLDELLDQHASRPVHWLKLDVEGLEKSVLESWQHSVVRPWILVIESTLPLTQEPNHEQWEPLVLAKGYEFAYFDGLNRFYVSAEHLDLKHKLNCPPNVFDDFMLSGLASQPFYKHVEAKVQRAQERTLEAESRATAAEANAMAEIVRAQGVQDQLARVLASRSWRITSPLRWLGLQARRLRDQGLKGRLVALAKKIARPFVRRTIAMVERHPGLRHAIVALARRLGLHELLQARYLRATGRAAPAAARTPGTSLSVNAEQIYEELKLEIQQRGEAR